MIPLRHRRDVVFGCVAENNPKYLSQALRLVQSLRWFGGTLSDAEFICCVVDGVGPAFQRALERFGAKVRAVQRFHPANPNSNKLRFLEMLETGSFETVVLLDCDTIIVQDPAAYLQADTLQARMAGYPTVRAEVFATLFSHFQLPLPTEEYRCAVSGDPTIWYCNAGVLIFPRDILRNFFPVWRGFTIDLCNQRALLKDLGNFCEQASLTLAYFKNPVPFSELPLELNCPIPEDSPRVMDAVKTCDPVIIHYHNRTDRDGLIISNSNPHAGERINAFNEKVKNLPT
jgi:hypothetical protein